MLIILHEFVEDLKSTTTAEAVAKKFIDFGLQNGASTVTTFFGSERDKQFVSTVPDDYYESCYTSRIVNGCHNVQAVKAGVTPNYFGLDICKTKHHTTKEGIEYNNSDYDHLRRRSGVTYPMPEIDGTFSGAGMGFGFDDFGELFTKRMDEIGGALGVAAFSSYSRMQFLNHNKPSNSPLSKRQAEILTYLAAGHNIDSISQKLGISTSAVNLYLSNLKKKLKVKTREQALAQALIHGWIST